MTVSEFACEAKLSHLAAYICELMCKADDQDIMPEKIDLYRKAVEALLAEVAYLEKVKERCKAGIAINTLDAVVRPKPEIYTTGVGL